ncbi:chloride channel protein [Acidomonas methanolica]|uniref:chloride channel protein n=1 Tax=Acidomonas methanolica TaxID=437 RepID=UPI00351CD9D4
MHAPALRKLRRVAQAPRLLRALIRADEVWLTALAAFVGLLAGVCVVAMTRGAMLLHRVIFGLEGEGQLSGLSALPPLRALAGPIIGGLALGAFGLLIARLTRGSSARNRPVDPIEANALHGGRMSVRDSLVVAGQTLISNGGGASIGLEAGFSQIAAAFGSSAGRIFRVRREDMRVLVGCGAGGAIGAAFGAPVAGAFYAFEVVIGSYSLVNVAPVALAAWCAVAVTRRFGAISPAVSIPADDPLTVLAHAHGWADATLIALPTALLAIGIMKGVAATERVFGRLPLPPLLRPAAGGLIVGALAIYTPSVLSAGHAAMRLVFDNDWGLGYATLLLGLKIVASCVSIGSGFRGGLFFASLYLGTLAGNILGGLLSLAGEQALSSASCALIGMSAMAVAVIGSPMTMICLSLEMTGDVAVSGDVLLASVVSLLTVRRFFGYAFATWRFHLRGESIRSAVDVSWMRTLNVARMMRREVKTLRPDLSIGAARRLYPLDPTQCLVLTSEDGAYAGLVTVAELHAVEHDSAAPVSELAIHQDDMLLPDMNVRDAIALLERAEADALAVAESRESRRVIGLLTEQYALRRYAEELDRTRRELAGETRAARRTFAFGPGMRREGRRDGEEAGK